MKAGLVIIKTGSTMPSLRAARGDFEDWIREGMGLGSGGTLIVEVAAGEQPPQPAGVPAVVVTGSHDMVTDRRPWSERTADWLRQVVASGAPVLGICYGHQLLAHALGGEVGWNARGEEMGTTEVTLLPLARRDPLLSGLPPAIGVHVSHAQSVTRLPPGAVRLAANAWDENQAFRFGPCAWGVQFHPEFDAGIMRAYAARDRPHGAVPIEETPFGGRILKRFASLITDP